MDKEITGLNFEEIEEIQKDYPKGYIKTIDGRTFWIVE